MMKSFVRTVGLACVAGVVVLANEAQGAATISLKAVRKNGTLITGGPVNTLSVARGDTITAEVYIFGWSTPPFDSSSGLVQTYNATVLGAAGSFSSGADSSNNATLVLPSGWFAPVVKDQCPCDTVAFPDCDTVTGNVYGCIKASRCVGGTNAGAICAANGNCPGGTCDLTGHNPVAMASLDTTRSDFIFFGFQTISSTDVSTLNVRFGAAINGAEAQTARRCQGGTNSGDPCTVNTDCNSNNCNANFLNYAGTLNLKVGAQACGTYTFNFSNEASLTSIFNADPFPVQVVPALEGLQLTVTGQTCPILPSGACCDTTNPDVPTCSVIVGQNCTGPNQRYGGNGSTCANISPPCAATGACCIESSGLCTNGVTQLGCSGRWGGASSTCDNITPPCIDTPDPQPISSNPEHCLIDARIPNLQGQLAQRRGFTSMTMTFDQAPGATADAPGDFQVTHIPALPALPVPPTITTVSPPSGNTVTLTFSGPIQPNRWTCVRHNASNKRRCIGFLPADANSNRAALPNDILDIIDSLNGIRNPLLQPHQCDIDRSGVCAPADIIAEIDLLNGVGYPNQNADTLEACPSVDP